LGIMVAASSNRMLSISCTFSSTIPAFSWILLALRSLTPQMVDLTVTSASLDTSKNLLRDLTLVSAPFLQTVTFSMYVPAVWSQRRAINLGTPLLHPPFHRVAPSLTSLKFASSFMMWGTTPFLAGLQSLHLTHLTASMEPSLDDFFRLFRATPFLQRLHLSHINCNGYRDSPHPLPLIHLTHLEFGALYGGGLIMLEKLLLTSVWTLRVFFRRTDNVHNILLRVGPVFNSVTTAIMDLDTTSAGAVVSLISSMPRIRLLDLRPSQPFVTETCERRLSFRAYFSCSSPIISMS
jgi:hypothetical protein